MSDHEATSRFSDNPFRDPNLPPDKVEYLDRRNEAIRHWHNTGCPEDAREFGFNLPDRRQQQGYIILLTECTTVEELIAAHHDCRLIMFEEGVDTAGFFCPGCGAWMDAVEKTE